MRRAIKICKHNIIVADAPINTTDFPVVKVHVTDLSFLVVKVHVHDLSSARI